VQPNVRIRVGRIAGDRIEAHRDGPARFVCCVEDRAYQIWRGQNASVRHGDLELGCRDFK
jgi:hypothetical protein